jgi:hypothetical protein
MNDLELRRQFDRWAEPIRTATPPPVTVIRSRARRRTARLAAATGSALAVTGIAAGLVATGFTGTALPARPGPWGSGRYPAPAGAPYVFVNTNAAGAPVIRDAATGNVLKVLQLPGLVTFTGAVAAANDRVFVLAQQGAGDRITFDEVRISAGGSAIRLRPILPGVSLPGNGIYGMSVNPAGTRLAMNLVPAGGAGPSSLRVYDLASGALIGSWPEATTGLVGLEYWPTRDGLVISVPGATRPPGRLRLLDTARPFRAGSALLADSRPDPALPGYKTGAVTADGSMALNVTAVRGVMQLQEFSTASGSLLRTTPIGSMAALRNSPYYCGVLWASANGHDVLTQCGNRQQELVGGAVTQVRLAFRLLAPMDGNIETFAW